MPSLPMETVSPTRNTQTEDQKKVQHLLANLSSSWKMNLYYIQKLPTLWWWGVRVEEAGSEQFQVSIPFNWRTQNPFRSIYFAALAGTAELSTGLLSMLAIEASGKSVSMLVTGMEAEFLKKANQRICFTCTQGSEIRAAIQQAILTGEGTSVRVTSVGTNPEGAVVARFYLTWSFKVRSGK